MYLIHRHDLHRKGSRWESQASWAVPTSCCLGFVSFVGCVAYWRREFSFSAFAFQVWSCIMAYLRLGHPDRRGKLALVLNLNIVHRWSFWSREGSTVHGPLDVKLFCTKFASTTTKAKLTRPFKQQMQHSWRYFEHKKPNESSILARDAC